MKRIDFLNELYHYLRVLSHEERNDILEDYREHFREGEIEGKTEEQICEELGSPLECAKQYVGDAVFQSYAPVKEKKKSKKPLWILAFIWNIIQAFISLPATFGLFLLTAIMIVAYCYIVPAIGSVAFLVFAISSTASVFFLAMITLLWTIYEIKICLKKINSEEK